MRTKRVLAGDLEAGTMMIQEGLRLPELQIDTDAYSPRWRSVKALSSAGLGRRLDACGWHLFFIGGQVKTVAFGRAGEKSVRTAIRRIGAKVRALDFNCLQLTEITRKRFLGLPYIAINAHAFHIQPGWRLERKVPARTGSPAR